MGRKNKNRHKEGKSSSTNIINENNKLPAVLDPNKEEDNNILQHPNENKKRTSTQCTEGAVCPAKLEIDNTPAILHEQITNSSDSDIHDNFISQWINYIQGQNAKNNTKGKI